MLRCLWGGGQVSGLPMLMHALASLSFRLSLAERGAWGVYLSSLKGFCPVRARRLWFNSDRELQDCGELLSSQDPRLLTPADRASVSLSSFVCTGRFS